GRTPRTRDSTGRAHFGWGVGLSPDARRHGSQVGERSAVFPRLPGAALFAVPSLATARSPGECALGNRLARPSPAGGWHALAVRRRLRLLRLARRRVFAAYLGRYLRPVWRQGCPWLGLASDRLPVVHGAPTLPNRNGTRSAAPAHGHDRQH